MKYGILLTKNTDNIGDDIQSYAQKRFLPSIDYVIDREGLNVFGLLDGDNEPVSVIMNAWYMYQKFNWPPSQRINPLFVSMHITKNDYFGIGDRFLDGVGGDYLRQYSPIGARDEATLQMLESKGIDAYLSGCLTLTLDLPYPGTKNDEVILVDVNKASAAEIRRQYPNENWAEVTHNIDPVMNAQRSLEERFGAVEMLLKRYQRAKCVITERLHCALPCLALGVPVLLLYRSEYMERMSSFLPLVHSAPIERVQAGEIDYDISRPPGNSEAYLEYRRALELNCEQFIRDTQQGKISRFSAYSLEQLFVWQNELLNDSELKFRSSILEIQNWNKELERAKQWLETQMENKDVRIADLESWTAEQDKAKEWFLEQIEQRNRRIEELEAENVRLHTALKQEMDKPLHQKLNRGGSSDCSIQ